MFSLVVPTRWKLTKLSNLGEVNRGRSRHRPRDAQHLYGGPYPFVQTGDVKASGGRINRYTQTYSEDGLAQSRLWPKGTMCITIAANIAETGILEFPACFPDSVIGFIPDKNKCNVYFIEYVFRFLRKRIQAQATGSVQDNINLQTLELLEFPIPDLDEQNRIADILCSFDNKIHLNTQTNQTLESIAQAIFKSWFVDFEPVKAKMAAKERWYAMQPTSESASPVCYADEAALPDLETYTNLAAMCAISGKSETELAQLQQQNPDQYQQLAETAALFPSAMVDSELGEIPEGYWVARFSDIIFKYIDNRGKTPPTQEAGIPLLEVRHLPASSIKPDLNTDKHVDEETYENWFRAHLESDDLIMSTVGTIGRLCMVPPNTKIAIAQNLLGLRFNRDKASPYFMYYQMNDFRFRNDVDARLVITVQASIKRKDLETIPLLSAPIELQKKFESFIKPFVLSQHSDENLKLAEIRDSLLPKLLSGEIDLTKVENEVT